MPRTFGSLSAYEPGLMDKARWWLQDTLTPVMGGDARRAGDFVQNKVMPTAEYLPGIGDAMAAGEAVDYFRQGQPIFGTLAAAGAAAGLVPGVGDAVQKGVSKTIKRAKENLDTVGNSNFNFYKVAGNQEMPLAKLQGGVAMNDPQQKVRVDRLVEQINSPEGYIERLVVDQNGNVLEGQHRLEALRQLGYENVPVSVIEDLDELGFKVRDVIEQNGVFSDRAYYLTNYAMEDALKHGEKALTDEFGYDDPKLNAAYKAAVRAALDAINPSPVKSQGIRAYNRSKFTNEIPR